MAKKQSFTVDGLTIKEGALEGTTADGRKWSPVACGDHRSVPVIERASNETHRAAGYNLTCQECGVQAAATAEHARVYGTGP
jgi:hypothetical protein